MFADPGRLRVFAAVLLGADSVTKVLDATGLPARDASVALRRLRETNLVHEEGGRLLVREEHFRELARTARSASSETAEGQAGESVDSTLQPFVHGDRLVRLPAQFTRRELVLRHVAARSFQAGVEYDERAVNDKLRQWCEGGEIDHVAVRRYLVDLGVMARANGRYWRSPED
ncbi:hypothetical protein SAMN05444320_10571 [Streptoalloteichus hindustanus]|uniref:DUF2087 domain-containing protein n=2 Tax=Streptoalloteichus hindustanus TaxID=2017 RepID=A0A1M5ENZ5_STRHI|nr:hypothetical protein SAMN05444320_10571 [Streptoalloteichus hindustanus]